MNALAWGYCRSNPPDAIVSRETGWRCSGCRKPRDREGQRLCRACHRENMRAWRRKNQNH